MEFTPALSSIFQNKKIKYNNKKPQKRNNTDKFFKNTQGTLHTHFAIAPFRKMFLSRLFLTQIQLLIKSIA